MAISSNLGYPRIGNKRQWKKAIELYWAGKLEETELHKQLKEIRLAHLRKQQQLGISLIPVNDFSYYDQVLDTSAMFGIVPARFQYNGGKVSTQLYYEIARGNHEQPASEMTKWFNTNYHYIVPEFNGVSPQLVYNAPLEAYREAKQELAIEGKPVIIGPYSYVKLAKGYCKDEQEAWINKLLPLYSQVLKELEAEGVQWIQLDEPALVMDVSEEDIASICNIYEKLAEAAPQLNIILQTYFESTEHYEKLIQLPIAALGLDGVHGWKGTLAHIQKYGFPADKSLAIGLIDGRNIWRSQWGEVLAKLEELQSYISTESLIIQPSCSLLHVPVSTQYEDKLPAEIRNVLAFADEKLLEVVHLVHYVNGHNAGWEATVAESEAAYAAFNGLEQRTYFAELQRNIQELVKQGLHRASSFADRYPRQVERLQLPLLPTTTIGSFPQTKEVRAARSRWRKGEWTVEQYDKFIEAEIDTWIIHQEQLGLDVLVHGEFERTDMVEFFGEKLGGFCFTANGWVQSYGSRCVKPPIIYGDVTFEKPMTVKETEYAQSRTTRPVKGMLTGPITIMNWSFVRSDISREDIAYQLAYALRQEVEALEQAGIGIIQVDEPAVREGLPLKRGEQRQYLDFSISTFRLTTCGVQDETQIHTHMCYCDFSDMISSIRSMDADVISIETSRSHGELIHHFEQQTYDLGIGLGVYDIHSPRVPAIAEMEALIQRALNVLDPGLFWINPDCGLKTRQLPETLAALTNMIAATEKVRQSLAAAKV